MTRPPHSFRPRSASSLLAWALSASALLGLASCEGAAGDVCQLDSDCETGLLCCKGSASLTDRGVCAVSCLGVDAGPRDLGAADAGSSDLGAQDAGEPLDLAMSVDLGVDAGPDDAGTIDAGSMPADLGAASDLGVEPMSDDAGSADAGEPDGGS
jgi:hypothetical protein